MVKRTQIALLPFFSLAVCLGTLAGLSTSATGQGNVFDHRVAGFSLPGAAVYLEAQPPLPSHGHPLCFEGISLEEGLSQSTVHVILQDQQGFMWFGTQDGLNKYDGYRFTVYKHDPEDPASLSNNYVRTIYQDREGELWIGTRNGLDRFDRSTGIFTHYQHDPQDPQSLSGMDVSVIFEDRGRTLWVGTEDGGLNQLDRATNSFTHYRHDPQDSQSLGDDGVLVIYEDRSGVLWIGTRNGGLDALDRTRGTFVHYSHDPTDPRSLSANEVRAIFEDRQGVLWVGTYGGGLDQLDRSTHTFIHYQHHPSDPHSLTDNRVRAILEDQAGELWIGTRAGLDQLDRSQRQFSHYRHNPRDPCSVSADSIWSIFEDRSGVLWIGTGVDGLSKYSPMADRFALYQHQPDVSNSLSDNIVWSIYEDRRGILWIGTFDGGLNRLERESAQFTAYKHSPNDNSSLSSNDVRAILEDRAGDLWVGTNNGLDQFDPETETFIHYRHDPNDPGSLSDNQVRVIYEDGLGNLWVGTEMGGLDRLDRVTNGFVHHRHDPDDAFSLNDNHVWAIFEDREDVLWVGTQGGINLRDVVDGRFRHYVHDPDDPASLSNDAVLSFYEDPTARTSADKGVVWIGTWGGGLNRLDRATQTFSHYTEKDGLPNDTVYGILADDAGYLWLSTNNGLSRFDPRTETFRNYDVSDGLQSNEFDSGAYFKSKTGEMFFGGVNGFNVFYPAQIQDNPHIPPIAITAFSKFNQVVRTDLSPGEHLQLTYRDNFVSFEFAALDYTAPDKNQYAYMLEGFDRDWVDAGTRRYASYTNLGGGDYVFRVKGSNNDAVWNEEGVAIRITVAPPYWETWWFRVIVILGLLGAVIGGYRLRVRSIEARSRELGHQIQERTRELEQRTHEIERRTQELEALNAIAAVVSRSLDLQKVLEGALDKTLEVMAVEAGGIYLLHEDTGLLTIIAHRGLSAQLVDEFDNLRVGEGFSGRVVQSGMSLVVNDISTDPRLTRMAAKEAGFHSVASFPLVSRERVSGALFVITRGHREFSQQDIELLTSISRQIGVAIENARLFQEARFRADELAVLNELGQALTARLNVEQVLDEAYRGASRLLDTTNFYIALYNPDEDEVTFALDVTEGELRKPYTTRKAGQGLTEYIIRHRSPLLAAEDVPEQLTQMGIEMIGPVALSWLGVPLVTGDRVLGVMAVQSYSTPRAYDEHDRDLLMAIANPVAIAVQNAHLFEETSSRAERLAVINRIASAASATYRLDELMETVYREIAPAFQADAFFIALYDQDAQELDFRFRLDQGVREPPERLPLGVGLTSIVVDKKEPLVIRDEQEWKNLQASGHLFGTMKPPVSWLGAPMLVGERVIGVISVQAYRAYAWGEEDQLLLLTIADQIAVALENARLFAEVEQRVHELEALYHADEELYRHLDLDQVLETLMDVAVDILQADKSSLMVWDAKRERLVVRAVRGFDPETVTRMSFAPGEGTVGRVAVSGEPAIVEDTHTHPHVARHITDPEGIRSFIHVPIEIGGQIFGVFNVDYISPRSFGGDELRLFTSLAQRAALAIENAQLYEQAQQVAVLEERQRLARDLHDAVTQTLFSASLIAEVLPALWDKDQAKARHYLQELQKLSRGALAEMRTLLLELRPVALVEAKIDDLLRQLAEAVAGRTGVPVKVVLEGQTELPADVHVALYRIAQEALNNVVKHARADQVTVELRCVSHAEGERVELRVIDNGEGFDPSVILPDHLGLRIMQERAAAVGAHLEIASEPGRGARVTVVWPGTRDL